jgi:hypothetical protein
MKTHVKNNQLNSIFFYDTLIYLPSIIKTASKSKKPFCSNKKNRGKLKSVENKALSIQAAIAVKMSKKKKKV